MKPLNGILLKLCITAYNFLYNKISKLAIKLNDGVHPKHRIMQYYRFFLDNISKGSRVLDIGCGIGFLAYKLSKKASVVNAIDIDQKAIQFAKKRFNNENIQYIYGDIMDFEFKEKFDYIILSNVLEHIKERKKLLDRIKNMTNFILVRVPMINRSWLPLYQKELGYEFRLDNTHYIEYTFEFFKKEMNAVGLKIINFSIQYGELWAKIVKNTI